MTEHSQAAAWPNETPSQGKPRAPGKANRPLFRLGQVVATPGALALLQEAQLSPIDLLTRHVMGDWGELCAEDKHANELALAHGNRLLSSYTIAGEQKLWVITEADRSLTGFLLPEEY